MKNPHQYHIGQHGSMVPRPMPRRILIAVFRGSILAALASSLLSAPVRAAQTIVVPRDYPTIQAAVDAAPAGSTIKVSAGTYTEQVVIAKNLTLMGAGVDSTIVQAPAVLTPYALYLPLQLPVNAVVRITDGASVSLTGVTVSGPAPCGVFTYGIGVVEGATLGLKDSRVTRIRPETTCTGPLNGRGVVVGLPPFVQVDGQRGSAADATITGVTVDQYEDNGITVAGPLPGGPASAATIANNLITGGASPFHVVNQYGVTIVGATNVQVKENTISENVCTSPLCGPNPITQVQSAGILTEAPADILQNQLSGNDIGVYQVLSPLPNQIRQNTIVNSRYFGIVIQDGDGATNENRISGGQVGIGVVADVVDTTGTLRADVISGTSIMPVQELDCCGFTATAIILSK